MGLAEIFILTVGVSGAAITLGMIALGIYRAGLASKLESERLRHSDTLPEHVLDQIQDLEAQVHRLTERLDFVERLGDGRSQPFDIEKAV